MDKQRLRKIRGYALDPNNLNIFVLEKSDNEEDFLLSFYMLLCKVSVECIF